MWPRHMMGVRSAVPLSRLTHDAHASPLAPCRLWEAPRWHHAHTARTHAHDTLFIRAAGATVPECVSHVPRRSSVALARVRRSEPDTSPRAPPGDISTPFARIATAHTLPSLSHAHTQSTRASKHASASAPHVSPPPPAPAPRVSDPLHLSAVTPLSRQSHPACAMSAHSSAGSDRMCAAASTSSIPSRPARRRRRRRHCRHRCRHSTHRPTRHRRVVVGRGRAAPRRSSHQAQQI